MTARWSEPVGASATFSEEQAQRVQALRAAREVIETSTRMSPFGASTTDPNLGYLIETAQWVMDGQNPEIARAVVAKMEDEG